jgi:hypothetical protein
MQRSLDDCLASVEAEARRAGAEPCVDVPFFLAMLGTLLRLLRLARKDDEPAAWLAKQIEALCALLETSKEPPRREWCDFAVYLARSTRLWAAKTDLTVNGLRRATRRELGRRRSTGWIAGVIPVADEEREKGVTPLVCAMVFCSVLLLALTAGTARTFSLIQ